jgi:uncharacterized protein YegJ (DUF2314 family)
VAKPIPVFAFAFAAFAATSERALNELPTRERDDHDTDDLFLTICRAPARARANFLVKLGLVVDENGRASGLCDRASAPAVIVEHLWLSQIEEGRSGFSGVVRTTPERRVDAGQRVSFELRHVLGWRLEANASGAPTAAPGPVRILRLERDTPASQECLTKECAARLAPDGDVCAQ